MITSEQHITKETVTAFFMDLQDRICLALEAADGMDGDRPVRFREDNWERLGGGGGRSRTLTNGTIIEKGGVGFSAVQGDATEATLRSLNLPGDLTDPPQFFMLRVFRLCCIL